MPWLGGGPRVVTLAFVEIYIARRLVRITHEFSKNFWEIGSGSYLERIEEMRESLKRVVEESSYLGLKLTNISARKLVAELNDLSNEELRCRIKEMRNRFWDETDSLSFLYIEEEKLRSYQNPTKGWEDIIGRFPETVGDIEEASKCLALSRYAASIFHGLQVVEFGLIDLGYFIGVADPKSGWTSVSNALRKIVGKKYEERTQFERDNFNFLEQVQATVEALKNAWRNKVSHAQGRLALMTPDSSPDIAGDILSAVKTFMRRLSEGLPPRIVK